MNHSYIAYIDESGDDGLSKFRETGSIGGSSKWLAISACVYRYSREQEAVQWRDEIKALTPKKKGRSVHFKDMNHHQKIAATQILAEKPLRFLGVLSNKTMAPENTFKEKNQLYWYLTRYLIERISWLCRDHRRFVRQGNGSVKIVFSRRGGMSYPDFQSYLYKLKNSEDMDVRIHWPVIEIEAIEAVDHSRNAGLQLADCGASAMTAAFEQDLYGNCEDRYLLNLKSRIYNRNENFLSYGLKLIPNSENMKLTSDQAKTIEIFKK